MAGRSELHTERDGHGPRMVLLHGFAQTARCWGEVADDLGRDHEVVRVDAPGHGGSALVQADLEETAQLIAEVGGEAVYLGYSMGARMALHVALRSPRLVQRLVLVGGTPGIEDEDERAARRERDLATAARIRKEGVEDFLQDWFDQPLFADLPEEARFLAERRRNPAAGLAASLERAGTGAQRSLWSDLPRLDMRVLAVAGQRDDRYLDIARRMAQAIGDNGRGAGVPHAGHAAHLEQPAAFLALLRPWLG